MGVKGKTKTTLDLPDEEHAALKAEADRQSLAMTVIVRTALREYLSRQERARRRSA